MSKVISCRDVGMDCDFQARGETEQEVMQKCAEHARSGHGMAEIPAELAAKVRAAIHDEPGKGQPGEADPSKGEPRKEVA